MPLWFYTIKFYQMFVEIFWSSYTKDFSTNSKGVCTPKADQHLFYFFQISEVAIPDIPKTTSGILESTLDIHNIV